MIKPDVNRTFSLPLRVPPPFEAENKGAAPINLVFATMMLVVVIWIGVLVSLGREIIQRVSG
jgi:hypothetical protein